jgi:hypothetical protein
MATAFVFDSDSISRDDYDRMMGAMGLADPDGPHPDGLIAHLAGAKPEGGWRVIDVWTSEDVANAFYGSDQFAPVRNAGEDAGITSTAWPLHRVGTWTASQSPV